MTVRTRRLVTRLFTRMGYKFARLAQIIHIHITNTGFGMASVLLGAQAIGLLLITQRTIPITILCTASLIGGKLTVTLLYTQTLATLSSSSTPFLTKTGMLHTLIHGNPPTIFTVAIENEMGLDAVQVTA